MAAHVYLAGGERPNSCVACQYLCIAMQGQLEKAHADASSMLLDKEDLVKTVEALKCAAEVSQVQSALHSATQYNWKLN